jgi:glucan 1,3-beta-glucosidase
MTGGAGAGQIAAAQTEPYPYPPVTLESPPYSATLLPSYTSTGSISTLPPPTYTNTKGATINAGDGWFDAQDTLSAPTPIAGCNYPNAWGSEDVVTLPPALVCGGAAGAVTPITPITTATTPVVPVAVTTTIPTTTAVARTTRSTAIVNTATALV